MNFIKQTALSVGFDACGIAKAEALIEDAVFMKKWLVEGNHADMHYLNRNFEKRINPQVLVPGCKSVVVLLLNYFPKQKQKPESPKVAKYAYSITDYHTVLKSKLKELEEKICKKYGDDCISTSHQHLFVDSAPVLERRWAERAGLGWIGKHTQLIHPGLGSYTFIGILMLNIDLEYDLPILPHCGTCTKCMDACPTKAIENGTLNARKCISYLTIESRDTIPVEFQSKLSDYILGCDICADVCPWNIKWAKPNSHAELFPAANILEWNKNKWQNLNEEIYNLNFSYSAIKRAGFSKLKQNIDVITKNNL